VDINNYCIKQCKRKYSHEKNIFTHPNSLIYKGINQLDAIFCLAVFQRPENRHSSQPPKKLQYNFDKFHEQITSLDTKLKVGGLLFIDHCDFSFADTNIYYKYKAIDNRHNRFTRNRPLYNKRNEQISPINNNYRIFQKLN
jgi:hypothetical protein